MQRMTRIKGGMNIHGITMVLNKNYERNSSSARGGVHLF
jgi:hypothetical protein